MLEPPASAQIICCMALLSFLLDVFVYFFLGLNPDFWGWLMRLALEKASVGLSCVRVETSQVRQGKSVILPGGLCSNTRLALTSTFQHRLSWVMENWGLPGRWWPVGSDDALDIMSGQEQAAVSWDWKSAWYKPLIISPELMLTLNPVQWLKLVFLHFLHILKWFNNFFLPVCISRNGDKKLSWLTQIVIKRELVIVPDLEDKLWWNLIFCLVQAPEVLLKSHRKRNKGKIKGLLVEVGRAWLLSSHSSWKSCDIMFLVCPAPVLQGQSHSRTVIALARSWTRMLSGKPKMLLKVVLVSICALI